MALLMLTAQVNPFASTLALLPPTSGLKQGPAYAVNLVSDLLKLDVLVTKASPRFPRLKGDSLSLPGTQPLRLAGPSAISSIIHRGRCPQRRLVYMVGIVRWGKIGGFLSHSPCAVLLVSPLRSGVWLLQWEEDGTQVLKHRRQKWPTGYHNSTGWFH